MDKVKTLQAKVGLIKFPKSAFEKARKSNGWSGLFIINDFEMSFDENDEIVFITKEL